MDNNSKDIYKHIERLTGDLCKIILTKQDGLNIDKAKQYIDNLKDDDKECLNLDAPETDPQVRLIVQRNITDYLKQYDNFSNPNSIEHPFEFDSGGAYTSFFKSCEAYYRKKNQHTPFPSVLNFILKYIQEMSEHYRIFSCFYDVRSKETASQIISDMANVAEEKTKEAVKKATKEAAEQAVKVEVENSMKDVLDKTSQTNVTILGIFAAIVLTAIAGLLYSTSVINNLATSDIGKLICICAFVGVVCVDLISILFYFIEKIKNPATSFGLKRFLIVSNAILLCVAIVFGWYSVTHPQTDDNKGVSEISASLEETNQPEEPSGTSKSTGIDKQ